MKKLFFIPILIIVFITASCSIPMSKESYLKKFDAFISEVSENYKTYSDKDWKKKTEKYEKFSGVWYDKFKKDFTLKDEIVIKAKQAKWYYCRGFSSVNDFFESINIKEMKEQVQYYLDNDMQDDLQKLYDDAKKAGKDAQEAVAEIYEELNVKIK